MNAPFDHLTAILERELAIYRRLETLLADEERALTALHSDRLLDLANEKEGLALQLKALEESRRLAVEGIAQAARVADPEKLTLLLIAQLAPEPYAARLLALRGALRDAAQAGSSRNATNKYLAGNSLQLAREAMDALAQPEESQMSYKPRGGLRAYRREAQVVARQA